MTRKGIGRSNLTPPRVLFVHVGRSPRHELIGEILAALDQEISAVEMGALDHLGEDQLNALRFVEGEQPLVTQLGENIRVVLSRNRVAKRFEDILSALAPQDYAAVVILTTALHYELVAGSSTVNAQRAMDSVVRAIAAPGSTVGVIYPLEKQAKNFDLPGLKGYRVITAFAAEQDREALASALINLAEADVILLNSLGYTEAERALAVQLSRRPVILPRRAIAAALRLVLQPAPSIGAPSMSVATRERLSTLTPREREILALICAGHSSKMISRQLTISLKTVEAHRAAVMKKMEARSLAVLIARVLGGRDDADLSA